MTSFLFIPLLEPRFWTSLLFLQHSDPDHPIPSGYPSLWSRFLRLQIWQVFSEERLFFNPCSYNFLFPNQQPIMTIAYCCLRVCPTRSYEANWNGLLTTKGKIMILFKLPDLRLLIFFFPSCLILVNFNLHILVYVPNIKNVVTLDKQSYQLILYVGSIKFNIFFCIDFH